MKKLWMVGALLMLVSPLAQANTRFGFGTITAVNPGDPKDPKKGPNFTVCYEFYNIRRKDFLLNMVHPFSKSTQYADPVYFLDGKLSTPEEALKVGRAVCMSDNEHAYHVSSQPGPQVPGAVGAPGNGIYRIELGGAFQTTLAKVGRDKKASAYEPSKGAVTLLVDCRDGKVVGVVALVGPNVEQSDYLLDPSVLRLQDGKLSGDIDFSVLFTEGDSMVTRDLQPVKVKFSLEVGADAKGVLTGTAKGTSGESAFSVAVKGDIVAATPSRDAHRVWLHFEDYGDGGHGGYTVLTAANGVLGAGHVLFYKGGKIGTASAKDGKLEGNRLQGTVGLEIDGHGQKASLTLPLTGVIFGNRLIFGTWTDAKGVKRTFRGGLVPAEGPQFESCNAEQKAILKSLQKASGEQKSPAKNNE